MRYTDHKTVEDLKVTYIGGGSRGWAWELMADFADAGDISGKVCLYDIDYDRAAKNVIIGNKFNELPDCKSRWEYSAARTLEEALTGTDFVIISILPGTYDEMAVDVHAPEKYDIWQSVGDTTGPGGILRALRTIPQMEVIAAAVRDYCPNAWVINYTNPMALCVKALYDTFPEIKAFGCCHEVFGSKKKLAEAWEDIDGVTGITREDVKINVVGVNHFTWITEATCRGTDLIPVWRKFCEKYIADGYKGEADINWFNASFASSQKVKMDLFLRYGYVAAAGDRHLAEFCPKNWYLSSPESANSWGFGLTSVDWRKKWLQERREERSLKLLSGEEPVKIQLSGEEGVLQMRALLGLTELITNVNLPNRGQIPNLPLGVVVETNAIFRDGSLSPVFSGPIPQEIEGLIRPHVCEQLTVAEAARTRNLDLAFQAFANDPLVDLSVEDARKLFDEMVEGTREYLQDYFC